MIIRDVQTVGDLIGLRRLSPEEREHHDEARDRLIVEALELARTGLHIGHGGVPAGSTAACPKCDALLAIEAALRVLGK